MPQTSAELAADALAARKAGAFAVHIHPRDERGAQTLQARACDAAVAAIRAAAPGLPVGISTAAAIDPDPFARARALGGLRERPDFVSVNVFELGWAGIARAALHAGIGVEVGLASRADVQAFARSPFIHQVVRALVEVQGGAQDARAVAELVPDGVAQLWHGYGERTWAVVGAAAAAGVDARIGLEDVLVLPNGSVAADNAELVAAALRVVAAAT